MAETVKLGSFCVNGSPSRSFYQDRRKTPAFRYGEWYLLLTILIKSNIIK